MKRNRLTEGSLGIGFGDPRASAGHVAALRFAIRFAMGRRLWPVRPRIARASRRP